MDSYLVSYEAAPSGTAPTTPLDSHQLNSSFGYAPLRSLEMTTPGPHLPQGGTWTSPYKPPNEFPNKPLPGIPDDYKWTVSNVLDAGSRMGSEPLLSSTRYTGGMRGIVSKVARLVNYLGPNIVLLVVSIVLGTASLAEAAFYVWLLQMGNSLRMASFVPIAGPILGVISWTLTRLFFWAQGRIDRIATSSGAEGGCYLRMAWVFVYLVYTYVWVSLWLSLYLVLGGHFFVDSFLTIAPVVTLVRALFKLAIAVTASPKTAKLLESACGTADDPAEFFGVCNIMGIQQLQCPLMDDGSCLSVAEHLQSSWELHSFKEDSGDTSESEVLPCEVDISADMGSFSGGNNPVEGGEEVTATQVEGEGELGGISVYSQHIRRAVGGFLYFVDGVGCFCLCALVCLAGGHRGAAGLLLSHCVIFSLTTSKVTYIGSCMESTILRWFGELRMKMTRLHHNQQQQQLLQEDPGAMTVESTRHPTAEGYEEEEEEEEEDGMDLAARMEEDDIVDEIGTVFEDDGMGDLTDDESLSRFSNQGVKQGSGHMMVRC